MTSATDPRRATFVRTIAVAAAFSLTLVGIVAGTATAAVPGAPAPIRPLPVCEQLQDPPTGACPIESEFFTLSSSGSLDGSGAVVVTITPSIPACESWEGSSDVWTPTTCYSSIGIPNAWESIAGPRCVYLDDSTGLLTPCLGPFQDSFTGWNSAVSRTSDWTIAPDLPPITGEHGGCVSVPNFGMHFYGGAAVPGQTWLEIAATTGECKLTLDSTPDNLLGASWAVVTAYLRVVRPGADAVLGDIELAEVYVGINGTLGPFAEVEDPDPDPDPDPFEPLGPFTDVSTTSYARDDIELLLDLEITNGVSPTEYGPSEEVTREQMAAFLARMWRALGKDCPDIESPFMDIPTTSYAYAEAACIFGLDVTTGVSATEYDPAGKVTREQMAAFLARMWRALGNECETGPTGFTDVAATSFAADDIECLFHLGITNGTSATSYGPSDFVSREQMAAFLGRLYRSHTT